jgi:hypothetical protein
MDFNFIQKNIDKTVNFQNKLHHNTIDIKKNLIKENNSMVLNENVNLLKEKKIINEKVEKFENTKKIIKNYKNSKPKNVIKEKENNYIDKKQKDLNYYSNGKKINKSLIDSPNEIEIIICLLMINDKFKRYYYN